MKIMGFCPMGCGETLEMRLTLSPTPGSRDDLSTSSSNNVPPATLVCVSADCPRPSAAGELLADAETEHIIIFDSRGFTVQHPLRERLDGELFGCSVHQQIRDNPESQGRLGRYRVKRMTKSSDKVVLEYLG